MTEKEIIGKLYTENQRLQETIKSLNNGGVKVNGLLRLKICDAQKYVMANRDMVPGSYYNELMAILERSTEI